MIAPDTLTISVDLTGDDADAAHRDGESAALALVLCMSDAAGPEHAARMAVGAIGMLAAVLAGISRELVATFLVDLGTAYWPEAGTNGFE